LRIDVQRLLYACFGPVTCSSALALAVPGCGSRTDLDFGSVQQSGGTGGGGGGSGKAGSGGGGGSGGVIIGVEAAVDIFCRKLEPLPCFRISVDSCVRQRLQEREQVAAVGCADEYDTMLRCFAGGTPTCSNGGDPLPPSECFTLVLVAAQCANIETSPPGPGTR
jgi:hypothetical protein